MADLTFHKLTLYNYQSYQNVHEIDLEFGPQFVFVSGENLVEPDLGANGVGKSCLWDAMTWCLYGKTPRSARPGNVIEPWNISGTVQVDLSFTRGKDQYLIDRTRRPNNLKLNGEIVEQGKVDLAIGMSYEAFYNTIILGQFNTLFLDLKPEQQASLFAELLNLDVWMDAARKAAQKALEFELRIRDIDMQRMQLAGQTQELTEQEESLAHNVKSWEATKKRKLHEAEADLKSSYSKLEKNTKLHDAPKGYEIARKNLLTLREDSRITDQGVTKAAQDVAALEARIQIIDRKQLLPLQQALEEAEPVCPMCGSEVSTDHLKTKIKEITNLLDGEFHTLDSLEHNHETLVSTQKIYQYEYDHCQEEVTRLRGLIDELNQAEREINDLERTANRLRLEMNPYTDMIKSLKDREKDLAQKTLDLGNQYNKVTKRQAMYSFWSGAFKRIRLQELDDALVELEVAANRNADALGLHDWGIEFRTERETQKGDVVAKFSVNILPPDWIVQRLLGHGKKTIPWEALSGGELQRWRLAVSMALSEVLLSRAGLQPNLEILDEPTAWMSEKGIEDLVECLYHRSRQLNRAVVLVDHRSLDRGSFDQVLWITKDQTGSHIGTI